MPRGGRRTGAGRPAPDVATGEPLVPVTVTVTRDHLRWLLADGRGSVSRRARLAISAAMVDDRETGASDD